MFFYSTSKNPVMKRIIICLAFIFGIAASTQAAFIVKHPAVVPGTMTTVSNNTDQGTAIAYAHRSFVTRLKDRFLPPYGDGDERWHRPGEGSRSLFWGLWGLFIWPLGILAIIHGIKGLNSRNGRQQDRAVLGLILGIGEVIAAIAFIIIVLTGGFFIIV
jgi:hypothetical protein